MNLIVLMEVGLKGIGVSIYAGVHYLCFENVISKMFMLLIPPTK